MKSNGFTLVELSIVLVIIGLLVGGILVGQTLIDSAKINRLTSDLAQYEVAKRLFVDKFRNLPGDNNLFPVAGTSNDFTAGDGNIDSDVTDNNTLFTGEIAHYWTHLSQSGMLDTDYSPDASSGVRAGANIPETSFGSGIYAHTAKALGVHNSNNTYIISNFSDSTDEAILLTAILNGSLPVVAIISLDSKFDDGIPNSGTITTSSSCYQSSDNTLWDAETDSLCPAFIGFGFSD